MLEKNIQFYIISDWAYSLRPFLLFPCDNASLDSPEDSFNCVHSSAACIAVECAFGEIDARWGILWHPLKFNLKEHRYVIDACMQLHNFILDFKEEHPVEETQGDEDMEFFSQECLSFLTANPEEIVGTFGNGCIGDEAEKQQRGRLSNIKVTMRVAGSKFRDNLRDKITKAGIHRRINRE